LSLRNPLRPLRFIVCPFTRITSASSMHRKGGR
jgi:hypothetical protein